jgi:hypothetical protein
MRSFNPVLLTALAVLSLGGAPLQRPPNDLWPVRSYDAIRPGCHVLVSACWRRAEVPRVGPREAFDPLWDELINWLAQSPVLTDIETFWVFDADHGHGWQLLVTGMPSGERAMTVRVPTGTMTYDDAPSPRMPERDVPDHGYVDVQIELSPKDAAAVQRERTTFSAGYTTIQQPIRCNYVALMPDGSLETVVDGRVIARGHDVMVLGRQGHRRRDRDGRFGMTDTRQFPVIAPRDNKGRAIHGCPSSVPWSLVEPHREQAYANHCQTLERLAERGGLAPVELHAVMHDRKLRRPMMDESAAVAWLVEHLAAAQDPVKE